MKFLILTALLGWEAGQEIVVPTPYNYDLTLADDKDLVCGTDTDYWFTYNSSSTQFEFWSTNSNGSGTDATLFTVDDGTAYVAITTGIIAAGGTLTQPTGDVVSYDNDGIAGGQVLTTTDPSDLFLKAQACWPGDGTCTAADTVISAGQDTTIITIDGADPTATCPGDNDTVTVTVIDNTGISTATVLTEGTDWIAVASVATTCANLATAINALAGVSATCTSPDVRIQLDRTTRIVTLAESTAACTTVSTGTRGFIKLTDALCGSGTTNFTVPTIVFGCDDPDSGILDGGDGDYYIMIDNVNIVRLLSASVRYAVSVQVNGTSTLSNSTASTALNIADDMQQVGMWAQGAATITVDGATTFAATRNILTLECTGNENINTITLPAGASGGVLLVLHHGDSECTLTDADDGGADTLDLDELDVAATLNVGADDRTVLLSRDGTLWRQVGKIVTN